jgi:hypothetical protein
MKCYMPYSARTLVIWNKDMINGPYNLAYIFGYSSLFSNNLIT